MTTKIESFEYGYNKGRQEALKEVEEVINEFWSKWSNRSELLWIGKDEFKELILEKLKETK